MPQMRGLKKLLLEKDDFATRNDLAFYAVDTGIPVSAAF